MKSEFHLGVIFFSMRTLLVIDNGLLANDAGSRQSQSKRRTKNNGENELSGQVSTGGRQQRLLIEDHGKILFRDDATSFTNLSTRRVENN